LRDASAISSISLSRAASKNAEYISRRGIRGRSIDADALSEEVSVGSCDKHPEQGSRWEAQAKEHGYKSAGLKDDVSEAMERRF
jgi:hypothetical protein